MRAYVWPYLVGWGTTLTSTILFFVGTLHEEEVWVICGWAGLTSLFLGSIAGFVLTDLVYGYEVNRMNPQTVPNLNEMETTLTSIIKDERTGTVEGAIFKDVKLMKWKEVAENVLIMRNFTVATVGQTERPKMIPLFLAAEYIVSTGSGKYEPTEKGYQFFESLKNTSPESLVFRKILERSLN